MAAETSRWVAMVSSTSLVAVMVMGATSPTLRSYCWGVAAADRRASRRKYVAVMIRPLDRAGWGLARKRCI